MCGFDLQQIPRLQMRLHRERTVLLTPIDVVLKPLRPQPSRHDEVSSNSSAYPRPERWSSGGRYLFAKIGTRDALAYPRLLPGSVVRVDRYHLTGLGASIMIRRENFYGWLSTPAD